MVTDKEIEIAFLSISCFASTLSIVVKIIQRKEVFTKNNVAARLLLCLAISDLVGAGGWLLQVWIRSCPLMMIFNFFGGYAASFFGNSVGFHLVAKIRAKQVRNRWFFIIPLSASTLLVLLWLGLSAYHPIDSPIEKCWLIRPKYDLIFSRGIDFLVFVINATLFGYTTFRLIKSRQEYAYNKNKMKGKERRLYFILGCFCLRTSFSAVSIVPDKDLVRIAILAICLSGFLNALAMNGKEMQTFFYSLYKRGAPSTPPPAKLARTEIVVSECSASPASA
eukprot:Phypoly_transcript_14921.p1 GENE.Phypoly_transcript_14921~~Phypoly_transcript_14921.p1  ORF type:complete len:279 (+),score=33.96 Phypoly_transcript_14921:2-838(+)